MALLKTMSGDLLSAPRVGFVRSLSRKRILIRSSSSMEESCCSDYESEREFESVVSMKKRRSEEAEIEITQKSVLESLPQEILIKIICGVNHDDLKQLFHVSKSLHEAAMIAKESHFAYATPSKIPAFRITISPQASATGEDEKAPNAPLRKAGRRRFTQDKKEQLMDVTVALFGSDSEDSEEERWPRRKLFKD